MEGYSKTCAQYANTGIVKQNMPTIAVVQNSGGYEIKGARENKEKKNAKNT